MMKAKLATRNLRCRRVGGREWTRYLLAGEGAWLAVWGEHYREEIDGVAGGPWMEYLAATGQM